ncbi:MotA/TolQ/ExbB proton channel family protein [Selenihalanaerobacter shriftii]|uniref:Biopolymer transport protein ExbB n=1 Tax=Selenihalanaerobacter shriftii TaxID=142842 RepID=A0A1T4K0Z7_9FIRM|nr:MotA/TolQ/ExbB proton channel family protein [Selenihalanaerobacter shriftii]SJZ36142.1 biopolymer transport protein ExbB [Selenihalanaerobacter shriftii]
MQYLLAKGGLIIYPLLLCSLVVVTIALERLYRFSKISNELSDNLMDKIKQNIKNKNIKDAVKVTEEVRGPIGNILKKGILNIDKSPQEMEEQMAEAKLEEFPKLEKHLGLLSFIGKISPSLGLLGTVTGMIKTFQVLSMNGEPQQLAGGISEALTTTATGLVISIPALGAYYYFTNKLQNIVIHAEKREKELINHIKEVGTTNEV